MDNGNRGRIATYLRVSTDEQAERGTIENQRIFLRNFAGLYQLNVVASYEDDGYSGTLLLKDRPEGRRLLEDARAGRFDELVVYRLDRLARKLKTLLDAHDQLEALAVTIRSATEPFDTGTPVGRLMFQLLGSIAEWEKASIQERTTGGRNRVAREGKWVSGPVPWGYDLDEKRQLIPSERPIEGLGGTEAEAVRDLYRRIAEGSTTVIECRRLNTAGVAPVKRYSTGKNDHHAAYWQPARLNWLLRNTAYKGVHVIKSGQGAIERAVAPLVGPELWAAADRQLKRNRIMSTKNAKHTYLLRGLIKCGNCGANYVGTAGSGRGKPPGGYYRCNSAVSSITGDRSQRCEARAIPVGQVEAFVWQQCHDFIMEPGEPLEEARRQLRTRLAEAPTIEARRREFLRELHGLEAQRQRELDLYRHGHVTLAQADERLARLAEETARKQASVESLKAERDMAEAFEEQMISIVALLAQLRERLAEVERSGDQARKRQIVELLVPGITVHTEGTGRKKRAHVAVRLAFGAPRTAVLGNGNTSAVDSDTAGRTCTAPPRVAPE